MPKTNQKTTEITYEVIAPDAIRSTIALALAAKLYEGENWAFKDWYELGDAIPPTLQMILAKDGDALIGITMTMNLTPKTGRPQPSRIGFYIKPEYRRQGIATQLLTKYKETYGLHLTRATVGIEGSEHFFQANRLTFRDADDKLHLFEHYRKVDALH